MASRKPITQAVGLLEQLQAVDTLTVGDYDLPNAISDDGKVLVTVNTAAVWEFYSHVDLTNITVDDHHDKLHTHNGADGSGVVEHDDTANITVDDHHDKLHTHNGADGSGVVEHDDTANITVDDHHDKLHTHNGADGSGVVEHDDTANGTIVNHDTDATGTELDTLTDGSNADALHTHSGSTLITTPQSYYVSLTGNDSTGDGSTGSRWATIQHALDYIYDQSWGAGSSATINIEEGEYRTAENIVQNKHCPLITIRGEDDAQVVTISAITSVVSGGGGVYAVTFTVDTTVGLSTGQYFLIKRSLGSRDGLNGAWEITNIADSTTMTIEIKVRTVVPATASPFNISGEVPKVVLTSTDATVFTVISSFITFSNLSIASNVNTSGIIFKGVDNIVLGPYVSVSGCVLDGAYFDLGSSASLISCYLSRCGVALRVDHSSGIEGVDCAFSASTENINAARSSGFELRSSHVISGLTRGVHVTEGSAGRLTTSCLLKDCLTGARCYYGSVIYIDNIGTDSNGTNYSPAMNAPGGNAFSWIRVA
jgi:hypothetical protein